MHSFVHITTFFKSPEERTVSRLSRNYVETDFLDSTIKNIIDELDNIEDINNKSILIKPNWVLHDRKTSDEICLRTHESVILVVIDSLCRKKPSKVIIGDAPVQGCEWEKLFSESFLSQIRLISQKSQVPVIIKDLRRTIFIKGGDRPVVDIRPISEYLIFDLGQKSFLETITENKPKFRVNEYNHLKLAESHAKGVHKYCISKVLFDSDIIISIPKAKTHQKAGVTCGLKNLVGLNGDKDYLPHHRVGGTGFGGDCYPGNNYLRRVSEIILDKANMSIGKSNYFLYKYISKALWKLSLPTKQQNLAAGWYGNDTTWRMVMDLNLIAEFGTTEGEISNNPQRVLYTICDGIIGGQGDGPLKPDPLPLGIISFSNNSGLNDYAIALLMGFRPDKIPLINFAFNLYCKDDHILMVDGVKVSLDTLTDYKMQTIPPPGWVGKI